MYSTLSSQPVFSRRKPRCSKCGLAMAGHKRPDGSPICPNSTSRSPSPDPETCGSSESDTDSSTMEDSFLSTPPPSPPRHSVPLESTLFDVKRRRPAASPQLWSVPHDPFNVPKRQRDANGLSVFPRPQPATATETTITSRVDHVQRDMSETSDSTVLVDDDGKTIRGSQCEDLDLDIDDGASISSDFFSQLATRARNLNKKNSKRGVVTMFPTQRTNVGRSQQLAAKQGMHTALVKFADKNDPRYGSWWMAVGRNSTDVYRVVSGTESQRRMPGVMEDLKVDGPRFTTFLEIVLAGIVAAIIVAIIVVYSLSRI